MVAATAGRAGSQEESIGALDAQASCVSSVAYGIGSVDASFGGEVKLLVDRTYWLTALSCSQSVGVVAGIA